MESFNRFITKVLIAVTLFIVALIWVRNTFSNHYPQHTNYVNDFANVISENTETLLNVKLEEYDKKTTNQIAVATITSLEGEEIEDYSIHLAEQWAPGTKEKDNGILMLFAMEDRKMRIEVGQGLEGDVTDIEARHILDDVIRPEFKKGDYDAGITKGVDAVILSIATDGATLSQTENGGNISGIIIIILVIGVVLIILAAASPYTPIGGQGTWGITNTYHSTGGNFWSSGSSDSDSGGVSFGGGGFSGGGSSSSW